MLVQRIKFELGMVRKHAGFHGYELASNWVSDRIIPIDNAEDMRRQTYCHWCFLNTLLNILNEGFSGSNAFETRILRDDFG
jgi:hypothetical protein